eukprot:gene28839-34807_t
MKANKHFLFAVGLLLISLVSRNSIAQNGYYFLTNQGLTIWKEPYKGWKEVADATLDSSALDSLSISEGIGMVAFKSNNGPSFLVSSFEHGDCKIYAEVLLPYNGKAGLLLQGRAPRFGERGVKTSYAKVWVKVNGVTVQNGVELVNSTFGGHNKAERLTGPLVFA